MSDDFSASNNPYQPPQGSTRRPVLSSGQRDYLLTIATNQKGILVCLLVRAFLEFGFLYYYERYLREIVIAECVVMVCSAYFIARTGMRLYGRFSGLYYGFISLTPFLGIFMLWTVNRAATLVLRHYGIRVGLFGATLSEI